MENNLLNEKVLYKGAVFCFVIEKDESIDKRVLSATVRITNQRLIVNRHLSKEIFFEIPLSRINLVSGITEESLSFSRAFNLVNYALFFITIWGPHTSRGAGWDRYHTIRIKYEKGETAAFYFVGEKNAQKLMSTLEKITGIKVEKTELLKKPEKEPLPVKVEKSFLAPLIGLAVLIFIALFIFELANYYFTGSLEASSRMNFYQEAFYNYIDLILILGTVVFIVAFIFKNRKKIKEILIPS